MTRLLIVRLGALGDIVHAMPAAAALRAALARRAHRLARRARSIARSSTSCAGSIASSPIDTAGALARGAGDHARRCARTRYDVALDLQGLIKSARARALVGRPRAWSASIAPHLREPLARARSTPRRRRRRRRRGARHPEEPGAADARSACGRAGPSFRSTVPLDRRRAIGEQLGAGAYALLNPGAAWPNKRWPADAVRRGRRVAAASVTGCASVVLWGPGERAAGASGRRGVGRRGAACAADRDRRSSLALRARRAR